GKLVTGVQTCALPICKTSVAEALSTHKSNRWRMGEGAEKCRISFMGGKRLSHGCFTSRLSHSEHEASRSASYWAGFRALRGRDRSEERRVGTERGWGV